MANDGLARSRNKSVTGLEQVIQVPAPLRKGLLQLEQRYGVEPAHLAAEAGRADRERIRSG